MLTIFLFLTMFIASLVLNLLIFSLIKSGFLGDPLKERLNYLLEKRLYLISIFYFILSLLIIVCLNNQGVYLDDSVVVTTKINDITFLRITIPH